MARKIDNAIGEINKSGLKPYSHYFEPLENSFIINGYFIMYNKVNAIFLRSVEVAIFINERAVSNEAALSSLVQKPFLDFI